MTYFSTSSECEINIDPICTSGNEDFFVIVCCVQILDVGTVYWKSECDTKKKLQSKATSTRKFYSTSVFPLSARKHRLKKI